MKTIWMIPLMAVAMIACQNGGEKQTEQTEDTVVVAKDPAPAAIAFFGSEITEEGAVDVAALPETLGEKDSMDLKVVGTIDKVCQVKGCWMTMGYGEGESMRISFRDYGFFVPKNIDGKEAVVEGTLYMETTSVEDLRHFAEDEGKSEEEIAMITEPETSLTFVADGVIVKEYEVEVDAASEEEQNLEAHDHEGHDHAEGGHEGHSH